MFKDGRYISVRGTYYYDNADKSKGHHVEHAKMVEDTPAGLIECLTFAGRLAESDPNVLPIRVVRSTLYVPIGEKPSYEIIHTIYS